MVNKSRVVFKGIEKVKVDRPWGDKGIPDSEVKNCLSPKLIT